MSYCHKFKRQLLCDNEHYSSAFVIINIDILVQLHSYFICECQIINLNMSPNLGAKILKVFFFFKSIQPVFSFKDRTHYCLSLIYIDVIFWCWKTVILLLFRSALCLQCLMGGVSNYPIARHGHSVTLT